MERRLFRFSIFILCVLERNFPYASEEKLAIAIDLGNPCGKVAALFALLKALVDVNHLVQGLSEVTAPHLVFNVFVPDPTVDHLVFFLRVFFRFLSEVRVRHLQN